jgi:hypothetical protein
MHRGFVLNTRVSGPRELFVWIINSVLFCVWNFQVTGKCLTH